MCNNSNYPSTTTWSNLVKTSFNVSNLTSWPKIYTHQSKLSLKSSPDIRARNKNDNNKILQSTSDNTNNDEVQVVKQLENLNIKDGSSTKANIIRTTSDNTNNEEVQVVKQLQNLNIKNSSSLIENNTKPTNDIRTREQILEERQIRKKIAREQKEMQYLNEKAKSLRAPKSQKIQIIDNKFLEKYQNASTKKTDSFLQAEQLTINAPRRTIKKNLKNRKTIPININDLIIKKNKIKPVFMKKNIDQSSVIIKKHKGKQHEFPKTKALTPLKKNILKIREMRQQMIKEKFNKQETKVIKEELPSTSLSSKENKPILVQHPIIIHSRKFRPYCNNILTPELNKFVESLLRDIFRFQKKAYDKNQIKGRAKKRYIVGLKEVQKFLELNKLKLLIISPDMEPNEALDSIVEDLKITATKLEIPYVFSLPRHKIGFILMKKVPVSCVGIINYDGSEDNYYNIVKIVKEERIKYENMIIEKS